MLSQLDVVVELEQCSVAALLVVIGACVQVTLTQGSADHCWHILCAGTTERCPQGKDGSDSTCVFNP